MKIYTSYFGNVKKVEEAGIIPVSISLYPPIWRKWTQLRHFAPTKDILFNSSGQENYTERFNKEILGKLDPNEMKQLINIISQGKDIALICFEKPGDFCHRHLVADWLTEKLGVEIEEFGQKKEEPKKCSCSNQQMSLF